MATFDRVLAPTPQPRKLLRGERRPTVIVDDVHVTFNAPVSREWWQANQGEIVRVLADATRRGRL